MVTLLLPLSLGWIELRGYIDESGNRRFAQWLDGLDALAAAKVTIALSRIEQGNFSQVKGVGSGVFEYKIAFGPGYRIYFGKDGDRLVILIGGGTKNGNHRTSRRRRNAGPRTNEGRDRRFNNAPHPDRESTTSELQSLRHLVCRLLLLKN